MAEISKSYEARDVEQKWYAAWLEAKAFRGTVDPAREPYSIVIPPPNVTGVLTRPPGRLVRRRSIVR